MGKPNVIPTAEQLESAKKKQFTLQEMIDQANYSAQMERDGNGELKQKEEVPVIGELNPIEKSAAEQMAAKREEEMRIVKGGGKVYSDKFFREGKHLEDKIEETGVMKEMERPAVKYNQLDTQPKPAQKIDYSKYDTNYTRQSDEFYRNPRPENYRNPNELVSEPIKQPLSVAPQREVPRNDVPFDRIPLPSKGLIYPHKKGSIDIAYLTTSDEDILTSPNLIANGDYKETLLNRKILSPEFNYNDLHRGDRDAILIWLRSTGYGHTYPVKLNDPATDLEFQTIIDLSKFKIKPLGAIPDAEGLFTYVGNKSKKTIKFKFLTVGDTDEITEKITRENESGGINSMITSVMNRMIVEIDGERNPTHLKSIIANLPALDSYQFRKYAENIESGVDLSLSIETPGGASIDTFLSFGIDFFWPEGI